MHSLLDNLTKAGKPPLPAAFSDGTHLLALPFGGRLLGLFPPEGGENFLWTNPALASSELISAWLKRDGWLNLGGDRTWAAPEIELFIGDLARPLETYAVPAALDPGNWTLASGARNEICLSNETQLQLRQSHREIGLLLSKCYRQAVNPLRGTSLVGGELQYAGYTQNTTLELKLAAEPPIHLGIWNLLQLPQPGKMLIPTVSESQPQLVFGSVAAEELMVAPRMVRWRMGGSGSDAKIALKAASLTGRAGYIRQTATPGICDLVVREFGVDPSGVYVDALWDDPQDTGWVFQACCVRNGAERFNELEYHASAAPARVSRDESHVWAYRGPEDSIVAAAQLLLGQFHF